jgi:IclR family acetate operon transcriptional repressor
MNGDSRDGVRATRDKREHEGAVQSLLRAINLLEALAEDDEGYRLIDLAKRTGLSTSTTHRLLTTLEQKRFVQFDRDNNLWHIGVQCFSIGSAFGRRRNLSLLAQPIMRRLRDLTGETVNLALADQGGAVFLLQVESRELMRAMARPGSRAPLQCTAVGQAILGAMSPQDLEHELAAILPQHGLPRLTPNSIARPTKLHEALDEMRKLGYAVDNEENALGLRCVAAPIYNELGRPFAAISISGPTVRVTPARVAELGCHVVLAAAEVTRVIGGRRPPARR